MEHIEIIQRLLSALEYHAEQTRPIQSTATAIQAAREHLQQVNGQAAEPVEKLGERCIDGGTCHHKCKDKCFRRECCSPLSGHAGPWAYPAPTQQPLTDDAKDAERYRWLKSRMMGADFDWNESGACALVFEWPREVPVGANCDRNIDSAIEAAQGIKGDST